ncbi:Asparagine--tRNA ligase, mitochondrial [Frankliniella fusca]|uniref:Asparagine--tRNA ligase, mitochondrial n=1 Tax=Frankliniella fusca TaxID=407009 RepID=A0AAE1LQ10_9NEOP|nr:Asparagine--tRNA ligase, mitochondrial [Frankliniella fusca]
MRVLQSLLTQARLFGLVTCIKKSERYVKPFRISKFWLLYSSLYFTIAILSSISALTGFLETQYKCIDALNPDPKFLCQ